jgi:DNA-binding transcriptional regulator YiaG
MPNIGALLKTEISRLCRREVRQEVAGVKKASASYRRDIAALKRQVSALQKKLVVAEKRVGTSIESKSAPTLPDRPVRFVAKGLRSLRTRLGLSAAQFALLLGVSEQSVYNWETKKALPRKEQFAAIIALRSVGKRDVQARLDALKSSRASNSKKKR